jgi:hypothetical protein
MCARRRFQARGFFPFGLIRPPFNTARCAGRLLLNARFVPEQSAILGMLCFCTVRFASRVFDVIPSLLLASCVAASTETPLSTTTVADGDARSAPSLDKPPDASAAKNIDSGVAPDTDASSDGGGSNPQPCLEPAHNVDAASLGASGCECGDTPTACLATASAELVNLECLAGRWEVTDVGPCEDDFTGQGCDEPTACLSYVGYACRGLEEWESGETDIAPTWQIDPTVRCPFLTPEQCGTLEDQLEDLALVRRACSDDRDCTTFGGVLPEQACDCRPMIGPYAIASDASLIEIQDVARQLEEGGCITAQCDVAPQEAACLGGACELVGPDSCLDG